jgi:hypothetical protein
MKQKPNVSVTPNNVAGFRNDSREALSITGLINFNVLTVISRSDSGGKFWLDELYGTAHASSAGTAH